MYLRSLLLLPTLAASVLANYRVEGTTYGVDSDLIAVPLARGARVTNDIYTRCQELDENGEQISEGEECVWNGLQYMIRALSDAHNALQAVALLSNTVSGVEPLPPTTTNSNGTSPTVAVSTSSLDSTQSGTGLVSSKLKRQDGNVRQASLDQLNDQLRRRSQNGRGPRTVQVIDSEIHPVNGLAIRTNIHSGDATLHVHTNGSHATAAFKRDVLSQLGTRDAVSTPGPRYQFQETTQGLKLEMTVAAEEDYSIFGTLLSDLAHGKEEMAPKLKESDSWGFVLCRELENLSVLRAKLVAEDDGAGYDWETIDSIVCDVQGSHIRRE
jgi:hypothetical protein